ncbi:hypothetical protein VPH35_016551 [Triticum aestivum]|uniref:Cytochrome P450 94A1 n=1 Tax=Aegilops tauschii TaxID=37682 RepID=M8BWQ2_AEGTA
MVPYMLCFQFVACCLLVLLYSLRSGSTSSAGHGPRSYPVIGCLLAFYENRRRLLDWYTEMLSASPTQTIVVDRLGARRTVVTANPANVEYILLGNFGNYPKGKPFTDVLGDLLGNGIFNVDGDKWFAQRKLVSHEFSARTLRELEIAVLEAEALDRLVPAMEAAAEPGGGAVDMQDVLRREMAFVQMKFVAGAILRRFDLRPVDEGRTPAFLPLLTSHMHGGLKVTVRRRKVESTTGNALHDAATDKSRSSFFS